MDERQAHGARALLERARTGDPDAFGAGRLRHLAEHGPSERAFTFKQRFPAPGG